MRIAFLNPWSIAAENQDYMSLAIAAPRIGLELVDCRNESDLELSRADFVISQASCVPKVCDYPTYLLAHEPPTRFLENETYLKNLMTYDGYFTISDSVRRFVHDVSFGIGRPDTPGFFYPTPQRSEIYARIPEIVKQGNLQVVYFGTNWDRRSPQLFEILDAKGILRIHGPIHSWPTGLKSYAGFLPIDGIAPQQAYCSFGIGLVLLSANHLREDVISNRIFAISSVGAVSICPDTPWIRKWYGDSVFYFDPWQPPEGIASQIINIHEYCKTHPDVAAKMGEEARIVFEKNFVAEVLLPNVVDYHDEKQRWRARKRKALGAPPLIAVIMRCGGRDQEYVKRAIASVGQQTFGRFVLLLVKYKNIDLSQVVACVPSNIERVVEFDVPNGNRGITLFSGLAKVRDLEAEYFAVLDDDDFWLSNHMESLFSAARPSRDDFDVLYSGSIAMTSEGREIVENLMWKRNVANFGPCGGVRSINDVMGEFSSNCFVARTDLLPSEVDLPDMETAEDSLLIGLIVRHRKPIFSYQATAFYTEKPSDGSKFKTHPQRLRDEVTLVLRSGLLYSPEWLNQGSISAVAERWQLIEAARRKELSEDISATAQTLASADLKELSSQWHWIGASITPGNPAIVKTATAAWGYSATLPLAQVRQNHQSNGNPLFWEIEAEVRVGDAGLGLIHRDELIAEKYLKVLDGRMTVYLPAAVPEADLMVRNGANDGASLIAIYGVRLVRLGLRGFAESLLLQTPSSR